METLSIKDASKLTGFSQKQLRNFEERGYMNPTDKITCGSISYRRYTKENIEELLALKTFIDEGFTLITAVAKIKEKK